MKIIYNKIIPFNGYKAINLFGVLFAREKLNQIDINHERIHTAQMKELLYVGFYILYIIEWLLRLILIRDGHEAYRMISFEVEAYREQDNLNYLKNRKKYDWIRYCLR